MSEGRRYIKVFTRKEFRPIAMQVLAAGALRPKEAIEYLEISLGLNRSVRGFLKGSYQGDKGADRAIL
jgi:hemolysin activation/secretion protein